ncbi:MAG: hypothetical protein N3A63_08500 [Bacteroidetes bacterium]|nr:hypothetical protein [Bacteroidota bacterium]
MVSQHQVYDIAIAWSWEYDEPFVQRLRDVATQNSYTVIEIHPRNLDEIRTRYIHRELSFRYFFDRASDENDAFYSFAKLVDDEWKNNSLTYPRPINPLDYIRHASDKATMHLEFITHGIHVPYTIIISPYDTHREVGLSITELAKLGRPFIIKPANTTGGGLGVVMGAETLADVLEARKTHGSDKYLLQETIVPTLLNGERAWFRVFYAFGDILLCWWNDQTHVYRAVTQEEEQHYNLGQLRTITHTIASLCKLDFFSTELAFTTDARVVSVDYVNEMCDMRFQSQHPDGVPDEVIEKIISNFIRFVQSIDARL